MAACWYPVTVIGPGKKLGIWFQGCNKKCEECISPEFQPYEGGQKIEITCLLERYHMEKPDVLVVSGGEPFDQPEALLDLSLIHICKDNASDSYQPCICFYI